MNTRNTRIDIIKGIGIILIVLGHTQMRLCGFVNLFHVGLFFVASGYCYKEKYSDDLSQIETFLIKRIKRLYLPFVLWNLGYLCFRNLFSVIGFYNNSIMGMDGFIEQAINILQLEAGEELAGPCWFVRALFILEVLFVLVDSLTKWLCKGIHRHICRWLIAVGMLSMGAWLNNAGIVLPYYNMSTICSVWILYVGGLEWKNFIEKKGLEWESSRKKVFCFFICGLILIGLSRLGSISYDSNSYPNVLFFLLAAVTGWGAVWNLAGLIEQRLPKFENIFMYIGRRTMSILFLHLLCFKLVSVLYVILKDVERNAISAFPVITNKWWLLYWFAGVGGSLFLCYVAELCKKKIMGCGNAGQRICICLVSLVMIIVPNFFSIVSYTAGNSITIEEELDYSLVYDEETYLEYNQDIADAIGKGNSEKLLNHFIEYGMDEGRIASEKFNVYYYKKNNDDLVEAYGEDMRQYYLHYMRYGHMEGRKGNDIILCKLSSEIVDEHMLRFHIEDTDQILVGESYYMFALPAYQYEVVGEDYILSENFEKEDTIVNFECDVKEHLNEKYVLAKKMDTGYEIVSNDSYIRNAEVFCQTNIKRPVTYSKKGLQVASFMGEDREKVMEELEVLNPSYPFTNLIIENIMYPDKVEENVITCIYKGKEYYFREDVILKYDETFAALTKRGASVTASVLSVKRDGFDELYYPDISMDTGASFYALNTTTQNGVEYLEAFVSFMSERYNGTSEERGLIANWIVGNEVNESGTYNYMGEKNIIDYLKEYTRTFRIIYNVVKSNIAQANVYVPMEPWWGIGSNDLTYGGREFLNYFNKIMCEEGDIDWGLAYHAYSYPLSDPKVLNDSERTIDENGELTLDGYVTTDSDRSVTITMENIEVLIEYMHQKEFLDKKGAVRSIILSEQGYTSNSNLYGKCEAQQAASMVYAYYKAEMLEDIDAFIYFVQRDNYYASLGNNYYLFGLEGEIEDGKTEKKLSYEVYQMMDTKNAMQDLEYIKNILGIEEWNDVISNFDETVFKKWNKWNNAKETKKDIGLATIDEIEVQKYTGSECLPEICVKVNEVQLVNDVDYDVVYLDNVLPGVAKVIVVGLKNYGGIKEVSFMICE